MIASSSADTGRVASNVTPFTGRRGSAALAEVVPQQISRVYLLGTQRAIGPAGEDGLPHSKKAQALLAYLCLSGGERVLRGRIAGLIWERGDETQARESLRKAVTELERVGIWSLEASRDVLRLDLGDCWIDALEIAEDPELLLADAYGTSKAFDRWVMAERTRYEKHWRGLLEADLEALEAQDADPDLRAGSARKLLNFLPTHEPAFRSLMKAFADRGDAAQVVREFENFKREFIEKYELPPSEQTIALYNSIRFRSQVRSTQSLKRPAVIAEELPKRLESEVGSIATRDYEASIAVLPLRDLSENKNGRHIGDGLVYDLGEALGRIPGFFVISHLATAPFGNLDRPPHEIGEALGVRYVVAGSIRVHGQRLRLSVELTDTESDAPLWNSRFDEDIADLFDMQDRLTEAVVRSVAPNVRAAELRRGDAKRAEDYDAYDLFLRAQENMRSPARAKFEAAEELFDLAIARAPRYSALLGWRAHWHVVRVGQGWSPDPDADGRQAEHFALRAVECGQVDHMALAVRGHVAAYLHRDFDLAFSCFEDALKINPNSPRAWLWSANAHAWIGDGARAVKEIERAMALSPYDPMICSFSGGASMAYLADGQYDRAAEFALRCVRENRGYTSGYKLLIMALTLGGHDAEARPHLNRLLLLEPDFTVTRFRDRFPGTPGPLADRCSEALKRAGVAAG